jgi:hypothetical protein
MGCPASRLCPCALWRQASRSVDTDRGRVADGENIRGPQLRRVLGTGRERELRLLQGASRIAWLSGKRAMEGHHHPEPGLLVRLPEARHHAPDAAGRDEGGHGLKVPQPPNRRERTPALLRIARAQHNQLGPRVAYPKAADNSDHLKTGRIFPPNLDVIFLLSSDISVACRDPRGAMFLSTLPPVWEGHLQGLENPGLLRIGAGQARHAVGIIQGIGQQTETIERG